MLVWIFVRALHPQKGLPIDHVAWIEIANVGANSFDEIEATTIKRAGRPWPIANPGRGAENCRLPGLLQ
jgi:hypothetical protein